MKCLLPNRSSRDRRFVFFVATIEMASGKRHQIRDLVGKEKAPSRLLVSLTRIIIFTMLKWFTTNARMFKAPTGRFFFFAKQYDANYLIVPFGASGNFFYVLQNTMASGKRHQIRANVPSIRDRGKRKKN